MGRNHDQPWHGAFCEFYVTIFKISEDLHVLRQDVEAERARQGK